MSLDTAVAWLINKIDAEESHSVLYERGALSVTLNATPGRTEYQKMDQSGVVTDFQTRDFIVTASDLILDGAVVLPVRGDTITDTAGTAAVYEVLPIEGEQPYRFSDPLQRMLRIHTKETNA